MLLAQRPDRAQPTIQAANRFLLGSGRPLGPRLAAGETQRRARHSLHAPDYAWGDWRVRAAAALSPGALLPLLEPHSSVRTIVASQFQCRVARQSLLPRAARRTLDALTSTFDCVLRPARSRRRPSSSVHKLRRIAACSIPAARRRGTPSASARLRAAGARVCAAPPCAEAPSPSRQPCSSSCATSRDSRERGRGGALHGHTLDLPALCSRLQTAAAAAAARRQQKKCP